MAQFTLHSRDSVSQSNDKRSLEESLQRIAGIRLVPDAEVRTEEGREGKCLEVVEVKHPTTIGLLLNLENHRYKWK